jgi:hypothetical protein
MAPFFRSLGTLVTSSALIAFFAACSDDEASTDGTGAGESTGTSPSGPGSTTGTASTSSSSNAGGGGGDEGGSVPNFAEPSRYPLELVSPREAGTLPSSESAGHSMPSGHRIFKAYPGIEYNIRAVVIAGSFPYTFSLSNAPAGMTIDASTGVVSWPSPTDGTVTPSITVVDAEGTQITEPWTITVSTNGFRFVDAINGNDGGPGTLQSPWQSIAEVKETSQPGDIVYFRSGTYTTAGMATASTDPTWHRVEINGGFHSAQWIAFPGETPVFDNQHVGPGDTGRFIRFSGSDTYPVYLDGFEITNGYDKGMQFGSGTDYAVFRRLDINDINDAIDGANSAGIMTLTSVGDPTWYGAYQDIDFHDNAPGGIKQYSHAKVLWEDLTFRDSGSGPDLKASTPRFEVRRSRFTNPNATVRCGIYGNMHHYEEAPEEQASGEIRYNLMLCPDSPDVLAQDVNQDAMAGRIELYRNTFIGTVRVNAEVGTGPFVFDANVIINSSNEPDHITVVGPNPPGVVELVDNTTGVPSDGLVDADGNLTGSYTQYLGLRGHQIP